MTGQRFGSLRRMWMLPAAMRRTRFLAAFLIVGVVLAPSATRAVSVRSWAPSSMEDFAPGSMDGTALDEHGHVRLAPALKTLWGPETGVVWAVVPAQPKGAFVALSGPARLLRVVAGEEPEIWYESTDEALVTALAGDSKSGVYFGVSPEGKVIHSPGIGRRGILFETETQFIWAILAERDGTLWVGTGKPGRLLRYRGPGELETVFESENDPIRSLASLPGGGIVAGTAARGRVIRFAADGRPFVLLDAEEDEIVSLAVAGDGTVYALAAGKPPKKAPAKSRPPVEGLPVESVTVRAKAPNDGPGEARSGSGDLEAVLGQAKRKALRGGGALYRLDPDGGSLRIWQSETDTPYASVVKDNAKVVVATGKTGTILELDRQGEGARLLRFPSDRASALALAPDGTILVGGTTDARVAVLGHAPAASGTYLSAPVDAGGVADWGRIRWEATVPRTAELKLEVRSGNTAQPDGTWSEWAAPGAEDPLQGATAPVPSARWFQARVTMRPSKEGRSPVLRRIELSYLPRNHPPRIDSLSVEPVGVAWSKGPSQSQQLRGPLVADDPVARRTAKSLSPKSRRRTPIRKSYESGARTFTWGVEDPDGDSLTFSVEIRREPGTHWFPLARGIKDSFFSWDSRAMPDGLYRVRLIADDSQDNPNGKHAVAERISDPFRVDNTPPSVTDFVIRSRSDRYEVSFVARDPHGRIEAAEYALDGQSWKSLDPLDGVADSDEERYRFEIDPESLKSSNRHLMVRVTDSSGNLGGDMRALQPPDT